MARDMLQFCYMRKILFMLALAVCAAPALFAQDEEIMLIKPGRETFAHFPSATLGNKHTLTVFLPEKFIPLKGSYPLAVLFGAGPKQAAQAEAFLQNNKMIVAAVDFQDEDYADADKITRFVSRELVPYLETNYPVLPGEENRIIAARGEAGASAALALLKTPHLFGGISLASPGRALEQAQLPARSFRAFVTGTQAELASAQQTLEAAGLAYGPGFALEYTRDNDAYFDALPAAYFFAPAQNLTLARLTAQTGGDALVLGTEETVSVRFLARLKNGFAYDYVPASLRISPMYLAWDAATGSFSALPGAEAGTVKIRPVVDKPSFSIKIKLKK